MDTRLIQPNTNRQLHLLLNRAGVMPNKADLVHSFTEGRTEHSSEMQEWEALNLINHLRTEDESAQRMRRKVLAICHTLGWYKRNEQNKLVEQDGRPVLDMERINNFCLTRGPFKKKLQKHTTKELTTLVTVFEKL